MMSDTFSDAKDDEDEWPLQMVNNYFLEPFYL